MQDSKLVYDQLGILAQSPIPCIQNLHCTRVPHVTQGMELALPSWEQVVVCQHLGNDMVPETMKWKQ